MNEVTLKYSVEKMKPAEEHGMRWTVELTDEEMSVYRTAVENELPLNEVVELQPALYRAKAAIITFEKEFAEEHGETFDAAAWGIKVEFIAPNKI